MAAHPDRLHQAMMTAVRWPANPLPASNRARRPIVHGRIDPVSFVRTPSHPARRLLSLSKMGRVSAVCTDSFCVQRGSHAVSSWRRSHLLDPSCSVTPNARAIGQFRQNQLCIRPAMPSSLNEDLSLPSLTPWC